MFLLFNDGFVLAAKCCTSADLMITTHTTVIYDKIKNGNNKKIFSKIKMGLDLFFSFSAS